MTLVTATIRDQAGNTYANALVEASFLSNIPPGTGSGPPLASGSVFQTFAVSETDSFGNLSMSLTDLAAITPSGGSWSFNVLNNARTIGFNLNSFAITGTTVDISAALQAASAPLNPQTGFGNITTLSIVNSGNYSGTTGTFTGLLQTKNFNQTLFADQFAGADMGAKINAAIAAAPATGCIIDATAFQGAQVAAATINVSKPCLLKLGGVTLQLGGSPGINLSNTGAALLGWGPGATILQLNAGTNDAIQSNAINVIAKGFSINSAVARTGGAGIRCKGGNGVYEDFTIDKTFNGIQVTDSLAGASGNNIFKRIVMGSLVSPAGSWNAGIILGGVASGTVTGEFFQDVNILGTSAFADSMVALDSGCDTNHFTDCQFAFGGVDSFCVSVRNTNTSNAPQWNKFTNCVFEAGTTKTAVTHSAGTLNSFVSCTLATCAVFFQFNGGVNVHVNECRMVGCQQQAINITAGTDIRVSNCRIADSSLQANSGFNTVVVSANVTDFSLIGNDFTTVLGSVNQPFQNVIVAAGTSDRYWITGNTFANFNGAGVNDGGTGTNKLVGFNSPFLAGSSSLYGVVLNQISSLNTVTLLNSQDVVGPLTGNGADQTIFTYTLPGKTMAAGKGIRVKVWWIHGTGTASVTYKLSFGATAIVNAASAVTGTGYAEATIMNQPASTTAQRASSQFSPTGVAAVIGAGNAPAEVTTGNVVVKFTFNVANTDQVTGAQWVVESIL